MEVAPSDPQIITSEPLRRGTPLPLSRLVEESRSSASLPNRLLESKIYGNLKSNGMIQAEPLELHFSGFELGKDYVKFLKLINISIEVMNIHIIPTQTRHFQTTYTKKCRLIPGLAYTLKISFCPDEWRYFCDFIRVHCKGEENLLIPVHAYPVIDDLHIPPSIDLAAVPLGQSVCHVIPLRCSCPTDFEFQVCVIQPHEAFSIHPLVGVIPANGEVKITVTFSPLRYETSQVTMQLVVSQFNTRPYLCTISGSSAPRLAQSQLGRKPDRGAALPAEHRQSSPASQVSPQSKTKHRPSREADKPKVLRFQADAESELNVPVDACTPAGVAKMLIRDADKLYSKNLKEAMCCRRMSETQNRQLKQVLFMRKVQQNIKEEQVNHLKWQIHVGTEPMSERARRQIIEEREIDLHQYMVKHGDVMQDEDFAAGQPRLSSRRVLREAGRAPEGVPFFHFHPSFRWELRRGALRLFQQAARKVVIRCRVNRRLAPLQTLADSRRKLPSAQTDGEEKTFDLKISPQKVFSSSFPVYSNEHDPLVQTLQDCQQHTAHFGLATAAVDPVHGTVTARAPFFKLQVPQRYKLMGYRPASAWEASNLFVNAALSRPLRTRAPDTKVPNKVAAQSPSTVEPKAEEEEEPEDEEGKEEEEPKDEHEPEDEHEPGDEPQPEDEQEPADEQKEEEEEEEVEEEWKEEEEEDLEALEALLTQCPANPLRIFIPAAGLQTYKPPLKYLVSDVEFSLAPVLRCTVPETHMIDQRRETRYVLTKSPDHMEMIPEIMKWKYLDQTTLDCCWDPPDVIGNCRPRRSDSTGVCPLTAPPPLAALPDNLAPLMDTPCEGSGVQLTPEMISREFLYGEALTNRNRSTATAARQPQPEMTPDINQSEDLIVATRSHQKGSSVAGKQLQHQPEVTSDIDQSDDPAHATRTRRRRSSVARKRLQHQLDVSSDFNQSDFNKSDDPTQATRKSRKSSLVAGKHL